ncbi:hypothetical protein LTR62_004237 [Meristemomyces frigidus]|uniref:Nop14-like protein n=1 Tax=Meristemomyces frigidus TaxID=1508187 RepID=A0AAN7YGD7_9PEZI|nr:hypothetical protein LTR62_004237 [Meristemomyces frigidus]
MPPSQLKALKSSLREKGIVGPQKSKKQKKSPHTRQNAQDRQAALQQIRDSFNPFEFRQAARPAKFASASIKDIHSKDGTGRYAQVLHRPGLAKSAGEEMRRRQLLPEMRQRSKVGGLVDRRIGEGDVNMTAEERAVQRFTREKSGRKGGVGNLFDLEGSDDEPTVALTHGGRDLDDFDDAELKGARSDGSDGEEDSFLRQKRPREAESDEEVAEEADDDQPDRKKTKKEVMEEVIAKSKMHKYERQKTKEDDEDLREQLDASTGDMLALLQGIRPTPKNFPKTTEAAAQSSGPSMDPGRQAMMDADNDKEYEKRLREYKQDARAKPAERTKTKEEKMLEEAVRLKEMEERRQKRMRGEDVSDDEDEPSRAQALDDHDEDRVVDAFGNEDVQDDAADFGFAIAAASAVPERIQHVDEDEFEMDDALIASDAEIEDVDLSDESEVEEDSDAEPTNRTKARPQQDDEEDEFVKGILGTGANAAALSKGESKATGTGGLSYTYPCPRTHAELLEVVGDISLPQLPTVIQRIRALHHPSLAAVNKEATVDFSCALVDHISYLANNAIDNAESFPVTEQIIRHIHSLSRSYPLEIANAFRAHLSAWHERPGNQPTKGDLTILVALGSIYPTSDHFHQVVTPAITLIARWLGLNAPETEENRRVGALLVGLCVGYQKLSRRYVPEAVRFTLRTLATCGKSNSEKEDTKAHVQNVADMADLWKDKAAFTEVFTPFLPLLRTLDAKKEHHNLTILLSQSRLRRRPLALHNHKPLAVRSSNPKFEEGYNPHNHYDPDKERSESHKLRKEVKRERKGAIRELRKDANFVARTQLEEKRERDAEHEKKQRRLIAEIQGEEAREGKGYEREKRARARAKVGGKK